MWWASSPTVHRDGDGKREQAWSIVLWRRHKAGLSVPVVFHMDDSPVPLTQEYPLLLSVLPSPILVEACRSSSPKV